MQENGSAAMNPGYKRVDDLPLEHQKLLLEFQTHELHKAGYRYTLGWNAYDQFYGTLIGPDGDDHPYSGCWSPAAVVDCMHYLVFGLIDHSNTAMHTPSSASTPWSKLRPPAPPQAAIWPNVLNQVAALVAPDSSAQSSADESASLVRTRLPRSISPESGEGSRGASQDVPEFAQSLLERSCVPAVSASNLADAVRRLDSLEQADIQSAAWDLILANPPFSAPVGSTELASHLVPWRSAKSEGMFVVQALTQLREGGHAALLIPDSLLFKDSKIFTRLREWLVKTHTLTAVISLPIGMFQPYAGVKSSILIITKGGSTQDIQFFEVPEAARPKVNRGAIEAGASIDLTDCVHWIMSVSQLKEGYRLDAGRYAPETEVPIVHEDPRSILLKLIERQPDIIRQLEELQQLVKKRPASSQTDQLS